MHRLETEREYKKIPLNRISTTELSTSKRYEGIGFVLIPPSTQSHPTFPFPFPVTGTTDNNVTLSVSCRLRFNPLDWISKHADGI